MRERLQQIRSQMLLDRQFQIDKITCKEMIGSLGSLLNPASLHLRPSGYVIELVEYLEIMAWGVNASNRHC
mgnify:CR=1 FL=1